MLWDVDKGSRERLKTPLLSPCHHCVACGDIGWGSSSMLDEDDVSDIGGLAQWQRHIMNRVSGDCGEAIADLGCYSQILLREKN